MRFRQLLLVLSLLLILVQPATSASQDYGGAYPSGPDSEIIPEAAALDKATGAGTDNRPYVPHVPLGEKAGQTMDKSDTITESKAVEGVGQDDTPSQFESFVNSPDPVIGSLVIRQFGYDLFTSSANTFTQSAALPVGPDYLIGPGDELIVTFWKKFDADYSLVVDREGKVNIPQVGIIQVAGLTFSEAKTLIDMTVSRYYRTSEVKVNVSMGKLRSMRVFVVGKVRRPGSHVILAMGTLINALFASGGPDKTGSMRDIQVKRNGETLVHFDLYDLLLKGDKSGDIRLMPDDVVFIPTVGPLAAVTGSVTTPAIYEIEGETGLKEIIDMAGGVTAGGYTHRVQIERVDNHRARSVLDVDFNKLAPDMDVHIRNGDIVRVFPISREVTNSVDLKGNVARPGLYEWREGLRIRDIIKSTSDLLPETLLDFVIIERLVPPDNHWEYLTVNPEKLLISGDDSENILLRPHDKIIVYNRWDVQGRKYVRAAGAVNRPDSYEFRERMSAADLIRLAGGPKKYADTAAAELTRVIPTIDGPETIKMTISPELALKGDPAHDIPLREDDHLFIRSVPGWQLYKTVTIDGEVKFPGTYTIGKGEKLSSLIERAGGFMDSAYLNGAVFTRESVKKLQQKQLNEAIDRLEQKFLGESITGIEKATTTDESQQFATSIEQRRNLIKKMREAKALGRISIMLAQPEVLKGTPFDITLDDGDKFTVPGRPVQVQVLGDVHNQNAYVYDPKGTISYYLKIAGGTTRSADEDEIYVLRVDGTAVSKRSGWVKTSPRGDSDDNRWLGGSFKNMRLNPGDTIYVPTRLEKVAWLREAKDITQILYQIAVTAGVLIVAF